MSDKTPYPCVLVSDFNLQNFAGYAANDRDLPDLHPLTPAPGPLPALLNPDAPHWRDTPEVALIWTRPESVSPAFAALLRYERPAVEAVLREVDDFCARVSAVSGRVRHVFVPAWTLPAGGGSGLLDMQPGAGPAHTLMRMNVRLAENLEPAANVHVLNAQAWVDAAGPNAFSPKLWYLGKVPFGNAVFEAALRDVKAGLRGILGCSRKLVLLDLDDTLWGGVVGEVGWENLVLGGHHHRGEAFADFQRALRALKNRGTLLAIVSKNEEQVALDALGRHPEMVLGLGDFAGRRINWQDKVDNILELLAELNLGPQSAVFIDDSPAERARVRESLPEVLVPEWPADPMEYPAALARLRCFETPSLSAEDASRTALYLSETRRRELRANVTSPEEWLRRLKLRVRVEALQPSNLQRTTQLLNKTNQMNLATRRMSAAELAAWAAPDHRRVWALRVCDAFGDAGLTGILSLEIRNGRAWIVDFVLSCRVMGRRIEEAMLAVAAERAGAAELAARYVATPRNKPCLDFFTGLAPRFRREGDLFIKRAEQAFGFPAHIELVGDRS